MNKINNKSLFWTYTREIMSYKFSAPEKEDLRPGAGSRNKNSSALAIRANRIDEVIRVEGWKHVLLLGLGDAHFAWMLDGMLPEDVSLTVLTRAPERIYELLSRGRLGWWTIDGRAQIIADTSNWSILSLLVSGGLLGEQTYIVSNPELKAPQAASSFDREEFVLLAELGKLLRKVEITDLQSLQGAPDLAENTSASLSFGAILSPHEPDLEGFVSSIPDLAEEIVIVWDACEVPEAAQIFKAKKAKVIHLARELRGDFAAQRNFLLSNCSGEWVLSLDADERLEKELYCLLPELIKQKNIGSYYLPRLNLYPSPENDKKEKDFENAKVITGFGLWPDPQLRLFRRKNAKYSRPVHEQLSSLSGHSALLVGPSILHLVYLLKDRGMILEKFKTYAEAGKSHLLNVAYPNLDKAKLPASGSPMLVFLPAK